MTIVKAQNFWHRFRRELSRRWQHIRPLLDRWSTAFAAGAVALSMLVVFFLKAPATWRQGMIENLVADVVVVAMAFAIFQVAHGIRERSRMQDDAEMRLGFVLRGQLLENAQWFKRFADQIRAGMINPQELGELKTDAWKRAELSGDLLTDVRTETLNRVERHCRYLATIATITRGALSKAKVTTDQARVIVFLIPLSGLAWLGEIAHLLHLRDTRNTIRGIAKEVELELISDLKGVLGPLPPGLRP